MENYTYINLRQQPELVDRAVEWFHGNWGVPTEAYLECMKAYVSGKTEYFILSYVFKEISATLREYVPEILTNYRSGSVVERQRGIYSFIVRAGVKFRKT